jgi:phosphatidylserine decarboxylase
MISLPQMISGCARSSLLYLKRADGSPLKEGQRVKKGEQIGYFQYGGSTHCLVFRAGVISEFALQAIPQGEKGSESGIVVALYAHCCSPFDLIDTLMSNIAEFSPRRRPGREK